MARGSSFTKHAAETGVARARPVSVKAGHQHAAGPAHAPPHSGLSALSRNCFTCHFALGPTNYRTNSDLMRVYDGQGSSPPRGSVRSHCRSLLGFWSLRSDTLNPENITKSPLFLGPRSHSGLHKGLLRVPRSKPKTSTAITVTRRRTCFRANQRKCSLPRVTVHGGWDGEPPWKRCDGSSKIKHGMILWSAIPLLGICPKELKTRTQRHVSEAALFAGVKRRKQPGIR